MGEKIRRIGILTSGGDAPGMNPAIRAAVRNCVLHDVIPVGIYRGYNGLIHSDVAELDAHSVNGISHMGGTMLYTARCEEFTTPEGLQKAVSACTTEYYRQSASRGCNIPGRFRVEAVSYRTTGYESPNAEPVT